MKPISVHPFDILQRTGKDCQNAGVLGGSYSFSKKQYRSFLLRPIPPDGTIKAAPRDNVVFEAGFFSHAKGNDRVLIIQEPGTKMPSDLGGKIYPSLSDKSDIRTIKAEVRRFVETI